MRVRVRERSPIASVRACVGRIITRGVWTELSDSFLEEVRGNELLEIEQVEPAELKESDAPAEPERVEEEQEPDSFGVVLAGNATTVRGYISSMRDVVSLKEMRQVESSGKDRKSILNAIDERLTEIEVVE